MAQQDIPEVYSSVPGSGGSGWEREINGPAVHMDSNGHLIYGYLNADGSVTPVDRAAGRDGNSQFGPYASSYSFPTGGSGGMPPPSLQSNAVYYGPGGGASTPTPGGGGPSNASKSIWDKIFGPTKADKVLAAASIGGNIVGNIIQSRQASKAAEAQEKAAAEALALQSNIYQQQRADLAPYRNAGASSLASLSYGLGLNPSAQADTTTPYFQQQAQQQNAAVPGQAQPRNPASLASLSGPVQLRAPNGQVKAVDPSQVQHYISMGAVPVNPPMGSLPGDGTLAGRSGSSVPGVMN